MPKNAVSVSGLNTANLTLGIDGRRYTLESRAPEQPEGDISASLVASRIEGPAPLAVYFDAMSTTHEDSEVDTWREIGYYFDYGDPGSGDWPYDVRDPYSETVGPQSKNIDRGAPLGAHVYETPGTYTAKVRAYKDGQWDDAQVTITVTDPDNVYSGSDTICIALDDDFTGAPSGATLLGNITSMPTVENGKRYLFKRGQDFTSISSGRLAINAKLDVQVGAFGDGEPPILDRVGAWGRPPSELQGTGIFMSRVAVMDIVCIPYTMYTSYDTLFLRVKSLTGSANIWLQATYFNDPLRPPEHGELMTLNRGIFLVESEIEDPDAAAWEPEDPLIGGPGVSTPRIWYSRGQQIVMMGNKVGPHLRTHARGHGVRGLIYRHNYNVNATTGGSGAGGMSLRALGTGEWEEKNWQTARSEFCTIGWNRFERGTGSQAWTPVEVLATSSSENNELVRSVILEANFYVNDAWSNHLAYAQQDITDRAMFVDDGTYSRALQADRHPDGFDLGPYYFDDPMPAVSAPD